MTRETAWLLGPGQGYGDSRMSEIRRSRLTSRRCRSRVGASLLTCTASCARRRAAPRQALAVQRRAHRLSRLPLQGQVEQKQMRSFSASRHARHTCLCTAWLGPQQWLLRCSHSVSAFKSGNTSSRIRWPLTRRCCVSSSGSSCREQGAPRSAARRPPNAIALLPANRGARNQLGAPLWRQSRAL